MHDCPTYSKMGDNGPTNTETVSFPSEQLPAIIIKGYASEKGNTTQAMGHVELKHRAEPRLDTRNEDEELA